MVAAISRQNTAQKAWYDYPYLDNYRVKYDFASYPVNGLDIPMPMGTPVTSVWSGEVSKRYCNAGGCQVIVKISDTRQSGGIEYYHFRHLDEILDNIQVGTRIKEGQLLGYSGGQNTGGKHPSAPNYSSGPHLGISMSHGNYIPFTLNDLGEELYPKKMIDYAKGTIQDITGITLNTNINNPIDNISSAIDSLKETIKWLSKPERIIKLSLGFLLIAGGIYLIARPYVNKAAKRVGGAVATQGRSELVNAANQEGEEEKEKEEQPQKEETSDKRKERQKFSLERTLGKRRERESDTTQEA